MDLPRSHKCGIYGRERDAIPRKRCSFCAALATSPDERTYGMKAIIEGEQLQMEMLELLRCTRPLSGLEQDYNNMSKVGVWTPLCQAHYTAKQSLIN